MITRDRLVEVLDYDQETGHFTWKQTMGGRAIKGQKAGTPHSKGYTRITVDQEQYLAHRLAWLYINGEMPKQSTVDHIDGDPSNDRIANLREATFADNLANRGAQSNNTSGCKGVSFDKKNNAWAVAIWRHGKKHWLGRFANKKDASDAYAVAASRLAGEFARSV